MTIEGPTEAKAGDDLAFKCVTGNSNPAAGIQWLVDGNQVDGNFTHSVRRTRIRRKQMLFELKVSVTQKRGESLEEMINSSNKAERAPRPCSN